LIERILDPSPDWKKNIDILINIPTSLKGQGFLRGGDYFEALFQLAIAIKVLPQFTNKFIRFFDIKNYYKTKEIKQLHNYLYEKPINNSGGGEQGISDITFEVSDKSDFSTIKDTSYDCGVMPAESEGTNTIQPSNPYYFTSVKGYKKEKGIKDSYDIPLLDQQIREFSDKNKHIIVCVRNKEQFLINVSRSKIDFLKNSINYVLGYDEVMDAFTNFRIQFFNRIQENNTHENIEKEVHKMFPKNKIFKQSLNLYFHQELVVKSVIKRINEVNSLGKPHFLCIGVLPRGGKSFIAGGIINSHRKEKDGYNVLFLTSAVNETRDQFKKDLIEKFSDFSTFDFIDVVKKEGLTDNPNKFYFISRQLGSKTERAPREYGKEEESIISHNIIDTLKEIGTVPKFDIVFFDEAHVGITSIMVRKTFQEIFNNFESPIILMTATYKKPAVVLHSKKDLFVWDLEDIKHMKSLPVLGFEGFKQSNPDLLNRYPDISEEILRNRIEQGESLEAMAKPYNNFPEPNFISLTFTPDTIQNLKDTGTGYNYLNAFQINVRASTLFDNSKYLEWSTMLINREEALRLRQFMTPEQDISGEEINTPFLRDKERKYRALNQIFNIAQKNNSRPLQGKPFSILMFLPWDKKTPVGALCRIWAAFMLESKYWKENFVFLTLSNYDPAVNKKDSKTLFKARPQQKITFESEFNKGIFHEEDLKGDLKQNIVSIEREALRRGKGLVILTGDVAKMGISLKCVDVVFLMSNIKEADDIIQKMYRALTDDPPNKKHGFIVDLNLKRIITAMYEYDLEKDMMRTKSKHVESVKERLNKIFNLCNWGQDAFIEDNPDKNFNDIMNIIKKRVLDNLENKIFSDFNENFKEIKNIQKQIFFENTSLFKDMIDILKYSKVSAQGTNQSPDIMNTRGNGVPDEPKTNVSPSEESKSENESPALPPTPEVNLEEIQKIQEILINILQTFVNALVIKSAESWSDTLNLSYLLEKYYIDKTKFGEKMPSCECNKEEECKIEHDNLYEAVFCQLKNYAMVSVGKTFKYVLNNHKKIIMFAENSFKNNPTIIQWNQYIENLLRDIKSGKNMKKQTGGKRKTRKIIKIYSH